MNSSDGTNTLTTNHSEDRTFASTDLIELPLSMRVLGSSYIALVFLLGLPGNLLIIFVQKHVKRKSSTDWFVLALAVCDVTSVVVNLPLYFLMFTKLWLQVSSTVVCKLHAFVHYQTYLTSAIYFALIGADRYCKVFRPHSDCFTAKRSKTAVLLVAIVSALMSIHYIIISGLDSKGQCVFQRETTAISNVIYYIGSLFLIAVTLTVLVAYFLVFKALHKHMLRTAPGSFNDSSQRDGCNTSAENEKHGVPTDTPRDQNLVCRSENDNEKARTAEEKLNPEPIPAQSTCSRKVLSSRICRMSNNRVAQPCTSNLIVTSNCKMNGQHIKQQKSATHFEVKTLRPTGVNKNSNQVRASKTNKTMAAASLLFVICTILPSFISVIWLGLESVRSDESAVGLFMIQFLYCVNLCANPYFYIGLSTRFRKNAKATLLCRKAVRHADH